MIESKDLYNLFRVKSEIENKRARLAQITGNAGLKSYDLTKVNTQKNVRTEALFVSDLQSKEEVESEIQTLFNRYTVLLWDVLPVLRQWEKIAKKQDFQIVYDEVWLDGETVKYTKYERDRAIANFMKYLKRSQNYD